MNLFYSVPGQEGTFLPKGSDTKLASTLLFPFPSEAKQDNLLRVELCERSFLNSEQL